MALTAAAHADVREVKDSAFFNESISPVPMKPDAAYRTLLQLRSWWHPDHTWSGSARNLRIEGKAGGCFCEKLANGGSVQHGRVIFANPGKLLKIDGALGPLQDMPVTGVLTFALAPDGPGTRITMSYRVAGGLSMDSAAKLAPLVDQVMRIQLGPLRDLSQAGARLGPLERPVTLYIDECTPVVGAPGSRFQAPKSKQKSRQCR